MNFTFGIITNGNSEDSINLIIDSIESQDIPNYEIIVIGQANLNRLFTKVINFDESQKIGWITKKKNLISQYANYENIVYMHDYLIFESGWYDGFLKYGYDFKICMNKILNADGTRFRDWTLDPWSDKNIYNIVTRTQNVDNSILLGCLLPYDELSLSEFMYISGSYWIAKKEVMLEFPLDENLTWGQTEDAAWSSKVRKKYQFSMNPYSTVKSLKQKSVDFNDASKAVISQLKIHQKGIPLYLFAFFAKIKRFIKKFIKAIILISTKKIL